MKDAVLYEAVVDTLFTSFFSHLGAVKQAVNTDQTIIVL